MLTDRHINRFIEIFIHTYIHRSEVTVINEYF